MSVCAILGLATASSPADPTSAPAESADRRVALNQSVSIDDPQPVVTPPVSADAADLSPSGVEKPVDDLASAAATGAAKPMLLRREPVARPSRGRNPSINERNVPWYRSGFGALAIVLAMVAGAAYLLRRWLPSSRLSETGAMRVVGRVGLTPKHTLSLVRVGRRFVMVGVSGDRLTTLCEIADADEVAELAARADTAGRGRSDEFDDLLTREGAQYRGAPEARAAPTADGAASKLSPRGWPRDSVAALLRRLKTLQTK